jgi:predicted NBD/HSP70 family sugar kinase
MFHPDETEIMRILFRHGNVSRVDIAESTGWSKPRVYQRVHQLVGKGLLEEIAVEKPHGKKKPILFRLAKKRGFLAGIEIQRSGLHLYFSDMTGEVLRERVESRSEEVDAGDVLSRSIRILSDMLAARQQGYPDQILGILVGVPGCVDSSNTQVVYSSSLPSTWEHVNIRDFFLQQFPSTSIVVESDVNISALAMQQMLPQPNMSNLIYIDIDEDIRAGIVTAGRIHRGFDACAGQIGHICVDKAGPLCSCGNTGCLNTLASETAIVAAALTVGQAGTSLALAKKFQAKNGALCLDDIFNASMEGDPVALEILQTAGDRIGEVIAGLVTFFNPDHIVIGCHTSSYDNRFLVSVRRAIYKHALPLASANTTIDFCSADRAAQTSRLPLLMWNYLFTG